MADLELASDDSSAASSGDEMLNMDIPFSQASSASPSKGSDDGGGGEAGGSGGRKRKHEEVAPAEGGGDDADNPEVIEEKGETPNLSAARSSNLSCVLRMISHFSLPLARKNAEKGFKVSFHDVNINKLYWHEATRKNVKVLYPVRVVTREETVGLALKEWDDETHSPIQFVQYPHNQIRGGDIGKYTISSKRMLTPYYGKDDNGDRAKWCATMFQQYAKQLRKKLKGMRDVDIRTEEIFLQLVLKKSLEEGEEEKKRAEVDEAVPEEPDASNEQDSGQAASVGLLEGEEEDSDDDTGGRRLRGSLNFSAQGKTERLRVGDVIHYYHLGRAGDQNNLCQATITCIDPKGDPMLTVDDPYTTLQNDQIVKRVKRRVRNKLVDHEGGQFRSIDLYDLRKEGDPNATKKALAREKASTTELLRRNKEAAIAKAKADGFCPEDMLRPLPS